MSQIKAVIFDLDDTLLDWSNKAETWDVFHRPMVMSLYTYLEEAGCALPGREPFQTTFFQQMRAVWENCRQTLKLTSLSETIAVVLQQYQVDPGRFPPPELLTAFGWRLRAGVVPYPETIPVLQQLHPKYSLGLITNSFVPMWMRDLELEAYGLFNYLPVRLSAGDFGFMKPHPAIFEHACQLLGVRPEQAVFVGDHPAYDIQGAKAAGIMAILMDPPHLDRDLNGVVPDLTITNLTQLLPILAQLNAQE